LLATLSLLVVVVVVFLLEVATVLVAVELVDLGLAS
jgi:hypothetical protein